MIRALLSCLLFLCVSAVAAEEDLLAPEKAFQVSARVRDAASLEVSFRVAKGYYLYKGKMKFSAVGVELGKPELPSGKVKQDEFFGRVEVYPADVRVTIPFSGGKPGASVSLKAEYQGCADLGVCYPPQESSFALTLPARSEGPANGGQAMTARGDGTAVQSPDLIARLKQLATDTLGGSREEDILPPEKAFQVALRLDPEGLLNAEFRIAPGHYLYQDKIRLTVVSPKGVQLKDLKLPKAKRKVDPTLGPVGVYTASFSASARPSGLPAGGGTLVVEAAYQGCSEQGICFPPVERTFSLTFGGPPGATAAPPAGEAAPVASPEPSPPGDPEATAAAVAAATPTQSAPLTSPSEDLSETSAIAAILAGGNFWLVVGSFFGAGLLLALTPCVFPMIPILSGIIVGQGRHVTKRKGLVLSVAYVLGMAVTYALAGVAAGLSGTLISNALQNPWGLGIGAAIFVALAFSMFGFYELQLPSFLQSRFTEASNRLRGGHLAGVFMMGVISALIVGPCVAAPLAGALLYIGQTGDVVLGGVSLFFLALGMGVPLLLVGVSAGALLPRAGGWMEAVKKFFGVLLLAVAIWLISPLISAVTEMLIWSALLIISGVYLRAVDPLLAHTGGWPRFWKGVGVISLVTGVALLLGALGGGRDVLQPLEVYKGGVGAGGQSGHALEFRRVANLAELDAALKEAGGRPVMLDFYADWCVSCKEMERFTFSDPRVQQRLEGVVLLQADVTANSADDVAMLKRFNLFGPPGLIFFDSTGRELAFRVVGYEPPEKFLLSLDRAFP